MKVALLTDGIYPFVIGGMQKHSFYLAKYLAAAGVRVDLYHADSSGKTLVDSGLFSEEELKNIRFFAIAFPDFGKMPGHYIRESYEYSRKVWEKFRKQSLPDFIYVKGFSGWELLNRKSKGEQLPPVGLNFHGYEMFQQAPSFLARLQARFLLRPPVLFNVKHADYLFSYGGKITSLIGSLGVARERIIEIPTGISEDWLNETPAKSGKFRRLVYVGRYERRKGVEELSAALRKLLKQYADFEFHFIGPIPSAKKIADDRVLYHGEIKEAAMLQQRLTGMDILVCPSYSEGMPNVVLEGLARGLAVIATDTGATADMVNGQNGWLIPPSDEAALLQTLEAALQLSSKELDEKKKNATRLVREKLLWTRVAEKTISAISACIATAG